MGIGLHRVFDRELWRLELQKLARWRTWVPAGHFYSPIPSVDEIKASEARIFNRDERELVGISLNVQRQLELLDAFKPFYAEIPFQERRDGHSRLRYYFANALYSYADAVVLYSIIRWARPRRVVEIGSGFSSALVLDTNELYFDGCIRCTFIEPHPERLMAVLQPTDRVDLRVEPVQETPIEIFTALQAGDLLIVDGSHVAKTGSDVNHMLFEVLPRLRAGVHVHIHDVFYPFEYPKRWVYQGVAWNEAYMVRAFLQYNATFEITLFTSYLLQQYRDRIARAFPLMLLSERMDPTTADAPGSSLWITRTERTAA